jgi:hypothetical protein
MLTPPNLELPDSLYLAPFQFSSRAVSPGGTRDMRRGRKPPSVEFGHFPEHSSLASRPILLP